MDCVVAVFFAMELFQNQEECSYEQTSRCTRYCFKISEKKRKFMLCIICRVVTITFEVKTSKFCIWAVARLLFAV